MLYSPHSVAAEKSLQQAFVVQVLILILDTQRISPETLDGALRRASEAVQRVVQARKYTQAA